MFGWTMMHKWGHPAATLRPSDGEDNTSLYSLDERYFCASICSYALCSMCQWTKHAAATNPWRRSKSPAWCTVGWGATRKSSRIGPHGIPHAAPVSLFA
eukprot:4013625-Pleurochrysis_carterae.AAC.1